MYAIGEHCAVSLFYRPVVGGGLLLVAAGTLYGLRRWHHRRTACHVAVKTAADLIFLRGHGADLESLAKSRLAG
jgi:hypothetical protein